ncbi:MAG: hypothetical protein IJS05_06340 [Paludibacteraceae bacterium]|nr:hypothetical protein [Paludibacteraceae bacterium]
MAQNKVEFTINLNGNAYKGIAQLDAGTKKVCSTIDACQSKFAKFGDNIVRINNIFQLAGSAINSITSAFEASVQANQAQQEAETKLAQVMRNTMDASDAQIESIKALTAAQQALGIVGDEVQLAGAQELGTYLEKTESLQKLIPVMNDMVAQQYGYNATQEAAVNIATMMGKVMDGQVGALSRYGYKFDEAQEKILKFGTEEERVATLADVISESVGGMNAALAATPEGRLKQAANRIGDIQERIGRLYVQIQSALAPIIETVVGVAERIMTVFESKQVEVQAIVDRVNAAFQRLYDYFSARIDDIRGVLDNLLAAFRATWAIIEIGWVPVRIVLQGVIGTFLVLSNAVRAARPFFIGLAAAIGIVTAALKWQDIWLNILIAKEALATTATNLWSGAQAILNAIMTANPIGLIIAGIALLIGAIVAVCSHITGWGSLWDGVCGFMKYSFYAFVDAVKLYFETYINGFLIGLDKIKLGWYKFKEACGIGDTAENQAAIAQINADVEKRQQAIIDGAKAVADNALKAKESLAGIEMGWKGKDKTDKAQASLGTNAQLRQAVSGSSTAYAGGQTGGGGAGRETGKSAEAVATGGTRKTDIHINLKSLVENMNFNGTTAENLHEIQTNIAQALLQALNMAQASVS